MNSAKKENGKEWRSFQENWRYQGNILWKNEHNNGQKQCVTERSKRC